MSMSLSDLEAWLNRLQQRIAALASSSQVQQLLAALDNYKLGTETRLNTLESKDEVREQQLLDHELRLQELEA